jgi:ketosteroid isomerase-like protein
MKIEIAKRYIELLSSGDLEGVINLFTENGIVESPIYGEMKASNFYKVLKDDTLNSELKLKEIFQNSKTENIALYFEYKWTIKTGKIVQFDVVDIIEFDIENRIKKLKIIYDTVVSRKLIDEFEN